MAIPQNKSELQEAIQLTYSKLKAELENIPVELTSIVELPGHKKDTTMSVCNLVAYLIGWGELVIKWHQLNTKKKEIDFPDPGFKWTELGELAQKFYKDYEELDYAALLKKLDKVVRKIDKVVGEYDPTDLYTTPIYKHYPMGRMIQLNTSSPYKNAHGRIRRWKKQKGIK